MNENQKSELDDATAIISNPELDDATEVISSIDEATFVVSGTSSVEEDTITNSNPLEENTISSPTNTGGHLTENSFTRSGEPAAPTPTKLIPIVEAEPEPDAVLQVETYIDPDQANLGLKVNKIDAPTPEAVIPKFEAPVPKGNALGDAAKLMKKNERRAKQGFTTIAIVVLGAVLIGATAAILLNGN